MANLSHVHSKQDLIIALLPQAADGVKPHGPLVTDAYIDLLIADVVKEISTGVADRALSKKALGLSKTMATQATSAMSASWEPDDDICPPWRFPFPRPWPWPIGRFDPVPDPWKFFRFDPDPVPWKPVPAAEQIELAHTLTQLAGLTASKEFNIQLKSLATDIAGAAAGRLLDDFERCGTVPRRPVPRPKPGARGIAIPRRARRGMTPTPVG